MIGIGDILAKQLIDQFGLITGRFVFKKAFNCSGVGRIPIRSRYVRRAKVREDAGGGVATFLFGVMVQMRSMGWFLPFCAGGVYDPWFKLRFNRRSPKLCLFLDHALIYPLAEDFIFFFRDTWSFGRHPFIQVCEEVSSINQLSSAFPGTAISPPSPPARNSIECSWKVRPSFSHRCDTPHNSFKYWHHRDEIHFRDKQNRHNKD